MDYDFDDYFVLERVKECMRIDFDDDDEQVKFFAMAALNHTATLINRNIYKDKSSIPDTDAEHGIDFNWSLRAAVMILATDLYENRIITVTGTISSNIPTYTMLVSPFMNYEVRAL